MCVGGVCVYEDAHVGEKGVCGTWDLTAYSEKFLHCPVNYF